MSVESKKKLENNNISPDSTNKGKMLDNKSFVFVDPVNDKGSLKYRPAVDPSDKIQYQSKTVESNAKANPATINTTSNTISDRKEDNRSKDVKTSGLDIEKNNQTGSNKVFISTTKKQDENSKGELKDLKGGELSNYSNKKKQKNNSGNKNPDNIHQIKSEGEKKPLKRAGRKLRESDEKIMSNMSNANNLEKMQKSTIARHVYRALLKGLDGGTSKKVGFYEKLEEMFPKEMEDVKARFLDSSEFKIETLEKTALVRKILDVYRDPSTDKFNNLFKGKDAKRMLDKLEEDKLRSEYGPLNTTDVESKSKPLSEEKKHDEGEKQVASRDTPVKTNGDKSKETDIDGEQSKQTGQPDGIPATQEGEPSETSKEIKPTGKNKVPLTEGKDNIIFDADGQTTERETPKPRMLSGRSLSPQSQHQADKAAVEAAHQYQSSVDSGEGLPTEEVFYAEASLEAAKNAVEQSQVEVHIAQADTESKHTGTPGVGDTSTPTTIYTTPQTTEKPIKESAGQTDEYPDDTGLNPQIVTQRHSPVFDAHSAAQAKEEAIVQEGNSIDRDSDVSGIQIHHIEQAKSEVQIELANTLEDLHIEESGGAATRHPHIESGRPSDTVVTHPGAVEHNQASPVYVEQGSLNHVVEDSSYFGPDTTEIPHQESEQQIQNRVDVESEVNVFRENEQVLRVDTSHAESQNDAGHESLPESNLNGEIESYSAGPQTIDEAYNREAELREKIENTKDDDEFNRLVLDFAEAQGNTDGLLLAREREIEQKQSKMLSDENALIEKIERERAQWSEELLRDQQRLEEEIRQMEENQAIEDLQRRRMLEHEIATNEKLIDVMDQEKAKAEREAYIQETNEVGQSRHDYHTNQITSKIASNKP
ncbi:hypothetical protein [Veronia pacifica]|uniref:Uncharacterized protein n=1 Tax=Veronia pacifica TaxID=1080227 RepID=A0A1C3ES94_9GAMM|nr:hypothetical protein [Veronia pacifica]ODA36101.1 hypothetical protein A8L45_00400 [Veronia pacifica]